MSCVHMITKGNTTKYFFCSVLEKALNEYDCYNCPLKIENKRTQDVTDFNDFFYSLFGGMK